MRATINVDGPCLKLRVVVLDHAEESSINIDSSSFQLVYAFPFGPPGMKLDTARENR